MTKVLVIEDDSFLVDAYSTKLRKAGFKTILATNGEEGLEQAKSKNPDVVLLDLLLPKRNGFDVLTDLKKDADLQHLPVIVLSNLGQERDIEQVRQLGADDYLIKANVTMKEVVTKIKALVKKKQSHKKHQSKKKSVSAVENKSEFKERTTDKVAKKHHRIAKKTSKKKTASVKKSSGKTSATKKSKK